MFLHVLFIKNTWDGTENCPLKMLALSYNLAACRSWWILEKAIVRKNDKNKTALFYINCQIKIQTSCLVVIKFKKLSKLMEMEIIAKLTVEVKKACKFEFHFHIFISVTVFFHLALFFQLSQCKCYIFDY